MIEFNNLTTFQVDALFVKKAVETVLKGEKPSLEADVSIALIGPGRMRKLNKMYRKKNRVTDILSFPEMKVPFEKFKIGWPKTAKGLGEIVICPREVKKNARKAEFDFEKELGRVLVHGALHLLGYEHEQTAEKAQAMEKKEIEYINKLGLA